MCDVEEVVVVEGGKTVGVGWVSQVLLLRSVLKEWGCRCCTKLKESVKVAEKRWWTD